MNSRVLCRYIIIMQNSVSLHFNLTTGRLGCQHATQERQNVAYNRGSSPCSSLQEIARSMISSGTEFSNFCDPRRHWGPCGVENGSLQACTEPETWVEYGLTPSECQMYGESGREAFFWRCRQGSLGLRPYPQQSLMKETVFACSNSFIHGRCECIHLTQDESD